MLYDFWVIFCCFFLNGWRLFWFYPVVEGKISVGSVLSCLWIGLLGRGFIDHAWSLWTCSCCYHYESRPNWFIFAMFDGVAVKSGFKGSARNLLYWLVNLCTFFMDWIFCDLFVLFLWARGFEIKIEYDRRIVSFWFIFVSILSSLQQVGYLISTLCLRMTKWSSSVPLSFVKLFCFPFVTLGGYKFLHSWLTFYKIIWLGRLFSFSMTRQYFSVIYKANRILLYQICVGRWQN